MGARRGWAQYIVVLGLLLGLFGTGCDRVLGIDGLMVLCQEGETQCSPDDFTRKQILSCNAEGRWVDMSQFCGDGQICKAGECAPECTYGEDEARCDKKEPLVCSDAGVWTRLPACPQECNNGQCTCKAGSAQCDGNKRQKCGENHQWQDVLDGLCVGKTCLDGMCVGNCEKGQARCLGNIPQQCNDVGEWEGETACEQGLLCHKGSCHCNVGDWRCFDNTPQVCNASNQWVNAGQPCVHATCDLLAEETFYCSGVCAPDEIKCKNKSTPQSCDSSGQWKDETPCSLLCAEGKCAVCNPGEKGCDGNTPQICGDDGQWIALMTCQSQTCNGGKCIGSCAPSKRCLGNTPQICNISGMWEGSTPCAAGQTCSNGNCTCASGDLRCSGNTPQVCNASNQWVDLDAQCKGQTCDPDLVECVGECEPGEKQCQDGNTPQICGPKGSWQVTMTCELGCFAGECAVCVIGEQRCTGNMPETCAGDGQWVGSAECAEQTCVAGICQGNCVAGEIGCVGKWPVGCDQLGQWKSLGSPCAEGESCYQGQCITFCAAGSRRCVGDSPQICNGNAQWQSDGPACGQCVECRSATGMCEPAPVPIEICTEPAAIEVGSQHTCGLFMGGAVKCWGKGGVLGLGDLEDRGNHHGEMGTSLPFIDLGLDPDVDVAGISGGGDHTCARTSDGRLKCWGANYEGQLGLGDTPMRGDHAADMGTNLPFVDLGLGPAVMVEEVSAGESHTCARMSNGRVKCWGYNEMGQLGLGDTLARGKVPAEMGASLPFVDLDLDPDLAVAEISAGGYHTCARLLDGRVKCWGYNGYGQLGLGDTLQRGDEPAEMGASLPFVDLGLAPGVTVVEIRAGRYHTCARTSDGRVKCWGHNGYGQLGLGDTLRRGDVPAGMGTSLPFVDLGLDPGVAVAEIRVGRYHTCARTSDGRVKCWGYNLHGQLGLGDVSSRGDGPSEMGTSLPFLDLGLGVKATSVRAGGAHTCVRLEGGSVKCWGLNSSGQLGLFDALNRGDEPNEMGDSLPSADL